MDHNKLSKAAALREEADALYDAAFESRPLPDFWRVGQKVRMINDSEWAWSSGDIMKIVELRDHGRPAREYQVFYTSPIDGFGSFWTTPADVELVEDAQ